MCGHDCAPLALVLDGFNRLYLKMSVRSGYLVFSAVPTENFLILYFQVILAGFKLSLIKPETSKNSLFMDSCNRYPWKTELRVASTALLLYYVLTLFSHGVVVTYVCR